MTGVQEGGVHDAVKSQGTDVHFEWPCCPWSLPGMACSHHGEAMTSMPAFCFQTPECQGLDD